MAGVAFTRASCNIWCSGIRRGRSDGGGPVPSPRQPFLLFRQTRSDCNVPNRRHSDAVIPTPAVPVRVRSTRASGSARSPPNGTERSGLRAAEEVTESGRKGPKVAERDRKWRTGEGGEVHVGRERAMLAHRLAEDLQDLLAAGGVGQADLHL
eukprot:1187395-Prorocentrum_minimum.AAC.1